ncbi:MAG: site-2 protease family protein [Spirochaetia bacterium]|nr:site-2 protease family protein [Spirochaetia bacterium]
MQIITQILAAVFLFGLCIFIHELGHYLIGKWVGIRAKIFSIGYGKGIWFKKRGKTIYQITAFPIGGYVQFYGDDPTKEHKKLKKGDFFAAGPWRRIAVAFAGPAFSLLLGVLVIFTLILAGWQPLSNKITLVEAGVETPAKKAGLKDGDKIVAINNEKISSFEELNYHIALTEKNDLSLKIDRSGKIFDVNVQAETPDPGAPPRIGIMPFGKNYLMLLEDKKLPEENLYKYDKIISVNDKPIIKIEELREFLSQNIDQDVNLTIMRKSGTLFQPEKEISLNIKAPVKKMEYILFSNVLDLQTEKKTPDIEISDQQPSVFSKIFIDNKSYSNWAGFKAAIKEKAQANPSIEISMGAVAVKANTEFHERGILGIKLTETVDPERAALPSDFISILSRTYNQTILTTGSTIMGLYRIFQGKLSFNKSISGPIKIFEVAALSVVEGWEKYWFLLAQISIILCIMNLLPIPVLDGGHIIFYLIEAVYKPIPAKKIEIIVRVGVAFLITLGIYVIGLDLLNLLAG